MNDFPLPPLREIISRYKIKSRKSLGQNFLLDSNLTNKIAKSANIISDGVIIEVGAGPGGLTRSLLSHTNGKIIAVECDKRCMRALKELSEYYPNRIDIITNDALKVDFHALAKDYQNVQIIANLPYNIASELLVRWLSIEPWPPFYKSMTLMFQQEVARRIVAGAGNKAYGRLSVLAAWRTSSKIVLNISRKAFTPSPKVDSSLVHIIPKQRHDPVSLQSLLKVTKIAFSQRRKMLRHNFKEFGGEKLLRELQIDPKRRAETLCVDEFITLAKKIGGMDILKTQNPRKGPDMKSSHLRK